MRVLFIGNSHTYFNDLPELVRQQCARKGQPVEVCMLTHGGKGLDFHAAEPQTRFNILYGGWDTVILQHRAHPMGDVALLEKALDDILVWVREAGSRAMLFQTWTRQGDEAAQEDMSRVYRQLGEKHNIPVIPIGDRWQAYRREHPDAAFYRSDGSHAAPAGSQLAAQVIAEALCP